MKLARCAIPRASVEITGRIVTRFGLSISLLGITVTHVRGQVAVTPLNVALAWGCGGVFAWIRAATVLIWTCRANRLSFSHVGRVQAPASRYRPPD